MKIKEFYVLLSLLCCCIWINASYPPKQPLVQTKYGTVKGTIGLSRNKRDFSSFRGIPYAKPPVGALRFKSPEPPEAWGNTFALDASKEGPFCIQKNYFFANATIEGQEDCLYLNIYVPKTDSNDLLPVMVWIHWGGFFAGRGTSDYMGPEYLMDKDVILVTFNYRLGVLGFLSTLDDAAPGNFGLKDQVAALKFVQENIESFGGDKNRVTVFGQSAGGGSVSLHLISPASTGLFQQAISQSGAALDLWAKPLNDALKQVLPAQATFVGCADHLGNNEELVECLRNVSASDLVGSGDMFKYFSIEPLTVYPLVTEVKTDKNPEPFLTKQPLEYLQAGEFQKIPWIAGIVQNEGILRAGPLIRQSQTRETLNKNFNAFIPQMLALQFSVGTDTSSLYKNMTDFYLGGENIDITDSNSIQGFIDMYTDRSFFYGFYQTVALQSMNGHTPIWVYNFDYRGLYTYGDLFAATNENINFPWGVCHCDDLLYLFKSPGLFPDLESGPDTCMSEKMTTIWSNFAIYGNPDPNLDLQWKPLQFPNISAIRIEDLFYLNITGSNSNKIEFRIENNLYKDRFEFWAHQGLAENFPGLL